VKPLALILIALLALLPSGLVLAQEDDRSQEGLILRIDGDVVIGAGETIESVIVIDGDLTIEGIVQEFALVIEGNATVLSGGVVENDLTAVSGDIDLRDGAQVHDIYSFRGDITRASGATVTGEVEERESFRFAAAVIGIFSVIFWIAMTIAVIVAGLVFAAIGGRQLRAAGSAMTGDAVNTIVGVVSVWVGLPILAVIAIITVVGFALGLGVLVFVLPGLWFLGYIVAGTRLGVAIVGGLGREAGERPLLGAATGLIILQLVVLVPVIGGLIVALAGLWGAGALAFIAYRAAGGKGFGGAPAPAAEAPV
jgi:hypothetical protein